MTEEQTMRAQAPAIAPAPSPSWDEVFAVPVAEGGDRLVPLSLAPERFLVRPAYFAAAIPGALPECHAREGVRRRLLAAQGLLPGHLRLVILDTWRSMRVQTALFEQCRAAFARSRPGAGVGELEDMASRFVAPPSTDPARPSPHLTGGAVDLALATVDGESLWFGAAFDHPGPVSWTRHFEERLERGEALDGREAEALANRRLLHHVMIEAGFVNYHAEWWHFEYGTQRWALLAGRDHAVYGLTQPELNPFESYARA
ncbi:M15 family metallopeptidase [Desulfocurvus sp. DL9XJH121]